MTMLDGRCEHGSLTMGCLYCQVKVQRDTKTPEVVRIADDIYRSIEDLERTRAVDAARIAVLEAEVLNLRTGR
jgi:hypothetical protein